MLPGGEQLKDALHLGEGSGVWFNSAEPRFVEISERGFAIEYAAPDLFADAALDVYRKVADILVGHA